MNPTITAVRDALAPLFENYPVLFTVFAAVIVSWLASWFLYVVLGKEYLGADDDYWEAIRRRLIPMLGRVAKRYGLYVKTNSLEAEYAGYAEMSEEEFERKLEEAGYVRQPLSSLHISPEGWTEDGSWARIYGPVFPVVALLDRIPVVGTLPAKFLRAADTIFAMSQVNLVYYMEDGNAHVFGHTEYNPLNPIVAPLHYLGIGFSAAPGKVEADLAEVGVKLQR